MKKLRVLDLFSGCGGLSLGFQSAGFEVIAGIDNWSDALLTFERNHPGARAMQVDLGNFKERDFATLKGKVDVVIGGPPCQGFSISGKRNPNDPRNKLYKGFVKTVRFFSPQAFVLENVPNLVSMDNGSIRDAIIRDFKSLGYSVSYKILLASDFGVPQNRRRVFFVGIKNGKTFEFPDSTLTDGGKVTAKDALSDLPESSVADGKKYPRQPRSAYQKKMRKDSKSLFNHQATEHDAKTIKIISMVPDGGNYKDLPERFRGTRNVHIAWTRYSSKKPSNTIDTGHRHHFHYEFNRVPTVRESARLQSFPDNFVFSGCKTSQYKQVGNAVPPLLAEAVAKGLLAVLKI